MASSGNGFMNTRSSRAPRAVTPHGKDHCPGRGRAARRGGPASAALAQVGDLVLDGDLAAVDLHDGAGDGRLHEVAQGHLDAALGREPPPASGAAREPPWSWWCPAARSWSWCRRRRSRRRPTAAPRDGAGEHGDRGRAVRVGGVGDQEHVVGEPVGAARCRRRSTRWSSAWTPGWRPAWRRRRRRAGSSRSGRRWARQRHRGRVRRRPPPPSSTRAVSRDDLTRPPRSCRPACRAGASTTVRSTQSQTSVWSASAT